MYSKHLHTGPTHNSGHNPKPGDLIKSAATIAIVLLSASLILAGIDMFLFSNKDTGKGQIVSDLPAYSTKPVTFTEQEKQILEPVKNAVEPQPFVVIRDLQPPVIPEFEILGETMTPYLRCSVGEEKSGYTWFPHMNAEYNQYNGGDIAGTDVKSDKILSKPNMISIKPIMPAKVYIPSVINTTSIKNFEKSIWYYPSLSLFYTGDMLKEDNEEYENRYDVYYNVYNYDEAFLKNAGVDSSSGIYTDVKHVPPEIGDLSARIVKGIENPYLKAKAIEAYLKKNYKYVDNPGNSPEDVQNDIWFLFKNKKGDCRNFSSAFVFLARYASLPARIVMGYKVDSAKKYQIVYSTQAYVYAEVKFDGIGWVPFDAANRPVVTLSGKSTQTDITNLDSNITKGQSFSVKGSVLDKNKKPVDGLGVLVYLKKNKDDDCLSYSKGIVSKGSFDVKCPVGFDLDAGSYQVVARALGNGSYNESSSDPEIKIMAETEILLDSPGTIYNGSDFKISGTLKEKATGKPIGMMPIELDFDEDVFTMNTASSNAADEKGNFQFLLEQKDPANQKLASNMFFAGSFKRTIGYSSRVPGFIIPRIKWVN